MSDYLNYFQDYTDYSEYIHINFYIHKISLACFAGVISGILILFLSRIYSGEIKINNKKKLIY